MEASLTPRQTQSTAVSIVNMRPRDILVYLAGTAPAWLTASPPHCVPSGSMASFQVTMEYQKEVVPQLGRYTSQLQLLAFAVNDPHSGLRLEGASSSAPASTCAASDSYTVAQQGVNASSALDRRSLAAVLQAVEGGASASHSSVELVDTQQPGSSKTQTGTQGGAIARSQRIDGTAEYTPHVIPAQLAQQWQTQRRLAGSGGATTQVAIGAEVTLLIISRDEFGHQLTHGSSQ